MSADTTEPPARGQVGASCYSSFLKQRSGYGMIRNLRRLLACAALLCSALSAQTYDLLIKGGHVIDPANRIDDVMDVAVSGSRIARVAGGLPASQSRKVIASGGLYLHAG